MKRSAVRDVDVAATGVGGDPAEQLLVQVELLELQVGAADLDGNLLRGKAQLAEAGLDRHLVPAGPRGSMAPP